MGYLGNLVSDLRGSVARPSQLYKSLRDSPSFDDKGYRFAYNLGTFSAASGIDTKAVRTATYEGLQRRRDFAALKQPAGRMRSESLIRRMVYQVGGRAIGAAIGSVMPTGMGGLGGRYLRVVAGRFSSLRLKRMEATARNTLLGEFQLDAKKVDNEVKKAARQNKIGLDKVARSIQAIAISDAPDYYALERRSRTRDGLSYNDEGVAAAISFQQYTPEDIDSMLKSEDIRNVIDANAVRDQRREYSVLSARGTTVDGATVMKPTRFTDRSAAEKFAKANNSSVIDLGFNHDEVLEEFKTMAGATYAFGDLSTMTQEQLVETAVNILNSEILRDAEEISGLGAIAGGYKTDRNRLLGGMVNKILENTFEKGLDPTEIGKVADASRYLRGDMTELFGEARYTRKKVGSKTFYSNYIDELHDDGTFTRHFPSSQTSNIIKQSTETVIMEADFIESITAGDLTPKEAMDARFYHPKTTSKTNRYETGRRVKTVNKVVGRQTQKGNFGTFQENEFRKVRASNKTYEHHGKTHTATSYDNPQRHNFIPNRRQIQSAIHVQEADTSKKDSTFEINVAFGGRTPQSKTNDAIRDAFQIEMGGPATDRAGRLHNRTDAFVFTPSLLMYNAGLKAATAYGLNMSAKKPVGAVSSEQIKQFGKKFDGNNDALLHGSTYKSSGRQDRIMEELYAKSRKDRHGNPLVSNGRLMLDKSAVMRNNVDSNTLEILSDTIDDGIFGGRYLSKGVRDSRSAFTPMNTGNPAIDIKTAQTAARKNSEFRFYGPDDAPDEFRDLFDMRVGQRTYDEPDISLYDVRVLTEESGQQVYEITGYKPQFGRSVGYGTARGQGVVSSDTAELAGGTPYDDLRILQEPSPDDPKFMSQMGLSATARQLQAQGINMDLKDKIRPILKKQQATLGLNDVQLEELVYKTNQRIVRNFIAKGPDGSGLNLQPAEMAVLIETQLSYIDKLSLSIRQQGIYSHRFKGRDKSKGQQKVIKLPPGNREDAIRDAEFSSASSSIFFDIDGFADAIAPKEIAKMAEKVRRGEMSQQGMFYEAAAEIEKSADNFLRNARLRDSQGRTVNAMEISGKKPKATPGTHYGSNQPERFGGTTNFNAGQVARRDASNYGLAVGDYRKQKKYVDSQVNRAATSNQMGELEFILQKVQLNSNVRRAFNAVIIREVFNGNPRDITSEDIRNYITGRTGNAIKFNDTIDTERDLNTEDPTLFE